jgi:hypothetical protein
MEFINKSLRSNRTLSFCPSMHVFFFFFSRLRAGLRITSLGGLRMEVIKFTLVPSEV